MKKAIVLGGTAPHIALIERLKMRGYYTVLVDYLSNPPAKKYADEHIQESTLDHEKVLEIARSIGAVLIMSACVDQANITACYVMEQLGLPTPYSYDTAKKITNKGYMKKIMWANDIPTSKYISFTDIADDTDIGLNYPVVVKPADSCAATGVKKALTPKDMRRFLKEALNISRNNCAVVEEFVEGVEVSAYCFVGKDKASVLAISQRLSVIDGENKVLKCFATITPAKISKVAEEKIAIIATQIARSFGLNNTPLHIQAIINEDSINIIEFAPRAGGGVSYKIIQDSTDFDIIDATIDSYLNIPVNIQLDKSKYIYSTNLIYANPGVFRQITGYEELIENGTIESLFHHKMQGAIIEDNRASASRVGVFIVKAETEESLLNKVKTAITKLDVINSEGHSVIRRDLCLANRKLVIDKHIM